MDFAFSEEQEELRRTIRRFFAEHSPISEVRRQIETEDGYDPKLWAQLADPLGLQALTIPEEYGGQGFGSLELTVVLEEMGKALVCAPFFATVVLAANALLASGDGDAKAELLPSIASGETIATLAFTEDNGRWDDSPADGGTSTGTRCTSSTVAPLRSYSSWRARRTACRFSPLTVLPRVSPGRRSRPWT